MLFPPNTNPPQFGNLVAPTKNYPKNISEVPKF